MRIGSLCSGYGGLTLAVQAALGGRVAWHSEIEPAADRVLTARFPGVPNIGDMTAVDWTAVEPVDVLEGGTPCQDVSHAGKRAGMRAGTRSGLWSAMVDAIDVLRPRLVVWENVRGVLSAEADSGVEPCALCVGDGTGTALRALGRVLGDLADLGYDARWCGLRAADVGAPHGRFRVFVAAYPAERAELGSVSQPTERHVPYGDGQGAVVAADPANVGHERGGRAWGGWPGSAYDSELAADAEDNRRAGYPGISSSPGTVLIGTDVDRRAAADTESDGRHEGWPEPARQLRRSHAAVSGATAADTEGARRDGGTWADAEQNGRGQRPGGKNPDRRHATAADPDRVGCPSVGRVEHVEHDADRRDSQDTAWGAYEPAIRRWQHITGRAAPAPTEPGRTGQRLSPRFVEWMMGLPAGWVTDVPGTTRNDQLKMLGNGVVPQQAQAALEHMLAAS